MHIPFKELFMISLYSLQLIGVPVRIDNLMAHAVANCMKQYNIITKTSLAHLNALAMAMVRSDPCQSVWLGKSVKLVSGKCCTHSQTPEPTSEHLGPLWGQHLHKNDVAES